jgi:hypothetical protein
MNKITGTHSDGRRFLALILEPGNIFRLCQKRARIMLRIEDEFPDGIPPKLLLEIHYSETPLADAAQLKGMAKMTFDERSAVTDKLRPHCPECHSTIEQLGMWKGDSPIALLFCAQCGCAFGSFPARDLPADLSQFTAPFGKEQP